MKPLQNSHFLVVDLVKRLKDTLEGLDAFLDEVVEEYPSSKANDDKPDKKCFIEILLHLQKEGMLDIDITQDNLKAILLVSLSPPQLLPSPHFSCYS